MMRLFLFRLYQALYRYNVFRLRAFLALADSEFDFLTFGQGFETLGLYCAEVHKYVRAVFLLDKTKTF